MILTGNQIKEEVKSGRITIYPFDEKQINPNSYDLRLGASLLQIQDSVVDPFKKSNYKDIVIPQEGLLLEQNTFMLGASVEEIGSNHFVPIIHGKSGIARLGTFVHITADLIDIGFVGNTTFQIYSTLPIILRPNMFFAQVSFWKVDGSIQLYQGKYQGAKGPSSSKYYLNDLDREPN